MKEENFRFKVVAVIKPDLSEEDKLFITERINHYFNLLSMAKADDHTYYFPKQDNTEFGMVCGFYIELEDFKKYFCKLEYYDYVDGENEVAVWVKTKDSDYISLKLSKTKVLRLIDEFAKEHKWFPLALKKLSALPFIDNWDISQSIKTSHIDKAWQKQKDKEWTATNPQKSTTTEKPSILAQLNKNKQLIKEQDKPSIERKPKNIEIW